MKGRSTATSGGLRRLKRLQYEALLPTMLRLLSVAMNFTCCTTNFKLPLLHDRHEDIVWRRQSTDREHYLLIAIGNGWNYHVDLIKASAGNARK